MRTALLIGLALLSSTFFAVGCGSSETMTDKSATTPKNDEGTPVTPPASQSGKDSKTAAATEPK